MELFFFSSRRRHTRYWRDWSSDVCSSDLLELALVAGVLVQRARERAAEAGQVRAALVGVDVVREAEDGLLVGGVPLHRHLDGALVPLRLEVDDPVLDGVLVLVEVGDEVADPALVVKLRTVPLRAEVLELDPQALRQIRRLAQALLEDRPLELRDVEDLGVR